MLAMEAESFLDWPVDFQVKVLTMDDSLIQKTDFTTAEGPYLRFYADSLRSEVLIIEGYEGNYLNKRINTGNPLPMRQVELSGDFKIIAK